MDLTKGGGGGYNLTIVAVCVEGASDLRKARRICDNCPAVVADAGVAWPVAETVGSVWIEAITAMRRNLPRRAPTGQPGMSRQERTRNLRHRQAA